MKCRRAIPWLPPCLYHPFQAHYKTLKAVYFRAKLCPFPWVKNQATDCCPYRYYRGVPGEWRTPLGARSPFVIPTGLLRAEGWPAWPQRVLCGAGVMKAQSCTQGKCGTHKLSLKPENQYVSKSNYKWKFTAGRMWFLTVISLFSPQNRVMKLIQFANDLGMHSTTNGDKHI